MLFAGCSDEKSESKGSETMVISDKGSVGGIGIGSTAEQVRKNFGAPVESKMYYPVTPADADPDVDHVWSEITGPYNYGPGGPPDHVQRTLIYGDVSFYTVRGKVIGILMTGDQFETGAGLKIGDPLGEVRDLYPDARCEEDYSSETSSVREANCDFGLSPGVSLNATDDPIESFTLE